MLVVAVTGITFPHKDRLKELGLRFFRDGKAWVIPSGEEPATLHAEVARMSRCAVSSLELSADAEAEVFGRRVRTPATRPAVALASVPVVAAVSSIADDMARVAAALAAIPVETAAAEFAEVITRPVASVEAVRAVATDRVREHLAGLKAEAVRFLVRLEALEKELA